MSEPSNTTQIHLYFESFFRDEIRNIVRDVYFVVWNKDDALDIAVDAFTKALVKWNSVSRLDRPGAWVRKVAMRAAIKFKKRRPSRDKRLRLRTFLYT